MESLQSREMAIFDICDTLFASNTTFDFLNFYLKGNKKYKRFLKIVKLNSVRYSNALLFYIFDKDFIRTRAIKFLAGKSKMELMDAAEAFYNEYLETKGRMAVLELLGDFRAKGMKIVLVSATLDFLAAKISEKLNVRDVFSSQLSYQDGICLGKMEADWLGCKEKMLKAKGIPIQGACVITDNLSDKQLISHAKDAIVITKLNRKWRWNGVGNIRKFLVVE